MVNHLFFEGNILPTWRFSSRFQFLSILGRCKQIRLNREVRRPLPKPDLTTETCNQQVCECLLSEPPSTRPLKRLLSTCPCRTSGMPIFRSCLSETTVFKEVKVSLLREGIPSSDLSHHWEQFQPRRDCDPYLQQWNVIVEGREKAGTVTCIKLLVDRWNTATSFAASRNANEQLCSMGDVSDRVSGQWTVQRVKDQNKTNRQPTWGMLRWSATGSPKINYELSQRENILVSLVSALRSDWTHSQGVTRFADEHFSVLTTSLYWFPFCSSTWVGGIHSTTLPLITPRSSLMTSLKVEGLHNRIFW